MFIKIVIQVVVAFTILSQSKVIVLNDDNFASFTDSRPFVFVQFYLPNCKECKAIEKEYQKAAQISNNKNYVMGKVDISVSQNTRSMYGIRSVPHFIFKANGMSMRYKYKGNFTANAVIQWIDSYFTKKIESITQEGILEKKKNENFVVFEGANPLQMKILFNAYFLEPLLKYYKLDGQNRFKITLHLKRNNEAKELVGNFTAQNLTEWTYRHTLPGLVLIQDEDSLNAVFLNEYKLPVVLLYYGYDLSDQSLAQLEQLCYKKRDQLKCGYFNNNSVLYTQASRYLRIKDHNISSLVYLQYGLKVAYLYQDIPNFQDDTFDAFLQRINQGSALLLFNKTKQPESPKKNAVETEDPIKYENVILATNETFSTIISQNKFVFVEYYSPKCSYCIKFAPEYEKLGARVKRNQLGFTIVAVNALKYPGLKEEAGVTKYPSFRFYLNGSSFEYNDNAVPDIQNILKFLNKAANHKLNPATLKNITKPCVTVSGIGEDSELHGLPALVPQLPIFHIKDEQEYKIRVFTKEMTEIQSQYTKLQETVDWIHFMSQPHIARIATEKIPKKLQNAIEMHRPIVAFIKRQQSQDALDQFQKFCAGRFNILCGYVQKGDKFYEQFQQWLSKPSEQSAIALIDTAKWIPYMYKGDLKQLTDKKIENFVQGLKDKLFNEQELKEGKKEPKKQKKNVDINQKIEVKPAIKKQTQRRSTFGDIPKAGQIVFKVKDEQL